MLQLSLSWQGLGALAASPWLLLLLAVASWLVARVLAWAYTFHNNVHRLRCFPQPPKRNWFWGHVRLVSVGIKTSLGYQARCVTDKFGFLSSNLKEFRPGTRIEAQADLLRLCRGRACSARVPGSVPQMWGLEYFRA